MSRPDLLALLPALLVLLAAACGGGDDSGRGEPVGGSAGIPPPRQVAGTIDRVMPIRAELWADPASDPGAKKLADYLEGRGAPEFLWIRVTVDNSGNSQPQTGRFFSFSSTASFDPLSEVQATFACSVLAGHAPRSGEPQSAFDAYEDLYSGFCRGQTLQVPVAPGETLTYWLLYEGDTWPQYQSIWAGAGNELK